MRIIHEVQCGERVFCIIPNAAIILPTGQSVLLGYYLLKGDQAINAHSFKDESGRTIVFFVEDEIKRYAEENLCRITQEGILL